MTVSFFGNQGLVHPEFTKKGQIINQHIYHQILQRLRESIRKKRSVKSSSRDWYLYHDNAPPHKALSMITYLARNGISTLVHSPYLPDLSFKDFLKYLLMKSSLKGRRFDDVKEIESESRPVLRSITLKQFSKCNQNLEKRMKLCKEA